MRIFLIGLASLSLMGCASIDVCKNKSTIIANAQAAILVANNTIDQTEALCTPDVDCPRKAQVIAAATAAIVIAQTTIANMEALCKEPALGPRL